MFKAQIRDLDLIEVLPPSSTELKENLKQIIDDSSKWHAALASLNQDTGTYRIILEGTLGDQNGKSL